MRREGDKLVIEASAGGGLLALLAGLTPIEDGFPNIDDPAPDPIDL